MCTVALKNYSIVSQYALIHPTSVCEAQNMSPHENPHSQRMQALKTKVMNLLLLFFQLKNTPNLYLCRELARRLRASALEALASATRLARIWAYSFCKKWLVHGARPGVNEYDRQRATYGLILDLLGLAALEGSAVTLVLETLGSNQTLDLGSLGVGLLALTLGLNLTTDDVLTDLFNSQSQG